MQFDKIEPLLNSLKQKNINICIETALTVPKKFIDIAIKYVDEFIIDIKILYDKDISKINGNKELYLKNVKRIFENNCKVIFRIPLVSEYTVTDKNIEEILKFLNGYKPLKVEIFKIHRLGEKKYKMLGKEMPIFKEVTEEKINEIKEKIEQLGIKIEYCKI